MHIVLFEPEIPQNTGNIARTCSAIRASLHLIKPLGFSLEDKYLKRAGLDYWQLLDLKVHINWEDFLQENPSLPMYFSSVRGHKSYHEIKYPANACFVFGSETQGLPKEILEKYANNTIKIPMIKEARSLNISNAVAVIAFEALRQWNFKY